MKPRGLTTELYGQNLWDRHEHREQGHASQQATKQRVGVQSMYISLTAALVAITAVLGNVENKKYIELGALALGVFGCLCIWLQINLIFYHNQAHSFIDAVLKKSNGSGNAGLPFKFSLLGLPRTATFWFIIAMGLIALGCFSTWLRGPPWPLYAPPDKPQVKKPVVPPVVVAPIPPVEKPVVAPISPAEAAAKLDRLAASEPQKLNWRVSIVDLLDLLNRDSSLEARKWFAAKLGCPKEKMGDPAQMNMWLHKIVLQKYAENGGNIPTELL